MAGPFPAAAPMTVPEVRTAKMALEVCVLKLVRDFEQRTGLDVIGFDFVAHKTVGGPCETIHVNAKVELS